jgi:hypothetical protein
MRTTHFAVYLAKIQGLASEEEVSTGGSICG